jgi:L-ribulose-5-phosphate 3-epimerase
MLRFAYNTNGLQSHRLEDAFALLAESGYHGVALTLDHMHLDPLRATAREVARVRGLLRDHGLAVSIETGARYVLDPRRKHRPTWLEQDRSERRRRSDLLSRSVRIAAELEAESVVLFSGVNAAGLRERDAWEALLEGLAGTVEEARSCGQRLALEPEPGHLVARLADYQRCVAALPNLGLALDVGHLPVSEPGRSIVEAIHTMADALLAVHIEDSHGLVHEHLPFGEGSLDHAAMLAALVEVGFAGLVAVELSRHSHAAHALVPSSIAYLRAALPAAPDSA